MYTENSQRIYRRLYDELIGARRNGTEDRKNRLIHHDLERAVMLGNLYNETCVVHYQSKSDETKIKREKVLAVTERYLIFRGGATVPLQSILKVEV